MTDWNKQIYFEDVSIGTKIPTISIPLDLNRMVMEAGANRDFSSIHHNSIVAKATGAPDAYMNSFFIMGLIERMLREWMGLHGKIKKIGPFRMVMFNCVGDLVTYKGEVVDKSEVDGEGIVSLDISSQTAKGTTVTGKAIVILPQRERT